MQWFFPPIQVINGQEARRAGRVLPLIMMMWIHVFREYLCEDEQFCEMFLPVQMEPR